MSWGCILLPTKNFTKYLTCLYLYRCTNFWLSTLFSYWDVWVEAENHHQQQQDENLSFILTASPQSNFGWVFFSRIMGTHSWNRFRMDCIFPQEHQFVECIAVMLADPRHPYNLYKGAISLWDKRIMTNVKNEPLRQWLWFNTFQYSNIYIQGKHYYY